MIEKLNFSDITALISPAILSKTLFSMFLVVCLIIIKKVAHQLIIKKINSNKTIFKWKRTINSTLFFLGIIILSFVWFSSLGSLTAFLGLITAALAFALRDIVSDLAGYVFVMIRRPFQVSDRIEIGGIKGDVLQIEWFQITVLEVGNWIEHDQSTGRIVYIPMGHVLSHPIFNYTAGFDWVWNEINVLVTFESDWKKAKKVILDIIKKQDKAMNENLEKTLKKAMQHHLIEYSNIHPIVYTNTKDSGINLTARYLCPTKKRRYSEHEFWEALLTKFGKDPKLELAYPTQRVSVDQT